MRGLKGTYPITCCPHTSGSKIEFVEEVKGTDVGPFYPSVRNSGNEGWKEGGMGNHHSVKYGLYYLTRGKERYLGVYTVG